MIMIATTIGGTADSSRGNDKKFIIDSNLYSRGAAVHGSLLLIFDLDIMLYHHLLSPKGRGWPIAWVAEAEAE